MRDRALNDRLIELLVVVAHIAGVLLDRAVSASRPRQVAESGNLVRRPQVDDHFVRVPRFAEFKIGVPHGTGVPVHGPEALIAGCFAVDPDLDLDDLGFAQGNKTRLHARD